MKIYILTHGEYDSVDIYPAYFAEKRLAEYAVTILSAASTDAWNIIELDKAPVL